MALRHAPRVVDGQHHLILPLVGFGATKPNLIFAEGTRNVRNNLHNDESKIESSMPFQRRSVHSSTRKRYFNAEEEDLQFTFQTGKPEEFRKLIQNKIEKMESKLRKEPHLKDSKALPFSC